MKISKFAVLGPPVSASRLIRRGIEVQVSWAVILVGNDTLEDCFRMFSQSQDLSSITFKGFRETCSKISSYFISSWQPRMMVSESWGIFGTLHETHPTFPWIFLVQSFFLTVTCQLRAFRRWRLRKKISTSERINCTRTIRFEWQKTAESEGEFCSKAHQLLGDNI